MKNGFVLNYGTKRVKISLAKGIKVRSFPCPKLKLIDFIKEFNRTLKKPIDFLSFNEWIQPQDKILIIVSDISRYTGADKILPYLVKRLKELRVPLKNIQILFSLGIHRKQTKKEREKIISQVVYGKIRCFDHNCYKRKELAYLFTTKRGNRIYLNKKVLKADKVILVGNIDFHYFAGFSGGGKSLLPGVASFESIKKNHLLVLRQFKKKEARLISPGILKGNPVAEEIQEVTKRVKNTFLINTILNEKKEIVRIFTGDPLRAYQAGCHFLKKQTSLKIKKKAKLLIASAGGYPQDINLIQVHKAIDRGVRLIKKGGYLILFASCSDGLGSPHFFKWFRYEKEKDFIKALKRNYQVYGQTAWRIFKIAQQYRVILISSLMSRVVKKMGLIPAKNFPEAFSLIPEKIGEIYLVRNIKSFLPIE